MSAVRNQHKRSDEASLDSLSSGAELEPDESVGSNENLRHPVQQRPPDRPAQPGSIEAASTSQSSSVKPQVSPSAITQEKLERGASLKPGEFQVLYQSPDTDAFNQGLSLLIIVLLAFRVDLLCVLNYNKTNKLLSTQIDS